MSLNYEGEERNWGCRRTAPLCPAGVTFKGHLSGHWVIQDARREGSFSVPSSRMFLRMLK